MEFTIDINDICYVHIDKKKKFPATALLRAFGYSTDTDVYQLFFDVGTAKVEKQFQRVFGNEAAISSERGLGVR